MSKIFIKFLLVLTFFINANLLLANEGRGPYQLQSSTQEVYSGDIIPPSTPPQGSGNIGTPGAQATPIDDHVAILVLSALMIGTAFFFYKKREKQTI